MERSAVVFVHGTQTPSTKCFPHDYLGVPVVDVPNETAKAAAPAGDEPAFATEMAAEGVVELAHGSAAGSVGPEVGVVEHFANSPGNESDALDSIGVWLLTVQHLSR